MKSRDDKIMPTIEELSIIDKDIIYSTLLREILVEIGVSGGKLTPESFYRTYMEKIDKKYPSPEGYGRKKTLQDKVDLIAARTNPFDETFYFRVRELKEKHMDSDPDLESESVPI